MKVALVEVVVILSLLLLLPLLLSPSYICGLTSLDIEQFIYIYIYIYIYSSLSVIYVCCSC